MNKISVTDITELFLWVAYFYHKRTSLCSNILCYVSSGSFVLTGIHSMEGWTATTRHGVTRKRSTKRLKHTGNLFRKNLQLIMYGNSRLKATQIIVQRKVFYKQRIPEFCCGRKENVDIGIPVTWRNGDRKILQSLRITGRHSSRIRKWNKLSKFR